MTIVTLDVLVRVYFMETQLTKTIKSLCHTYAPKMSSGKVGRTIRYADEVWVPDKGIVDSIRFEDYIISRHEECELENWKHYASNDKKSLELYSKRYGTKPGHCKVDGMCYPNKNCKGCFHLRKGIPKVGMMITAYEVKITKKDFLSKNGHNIDDPAFPVGNENYYCLPKELIPKGEEMVPSHCGILSYQNRCLRKYREAKWMEVNKDIQILLLYNAMKKWCDT